MDIPWIFQGCQAVIYAVTGSILPHSRLGVIIIIKYYIQKSAFTAFI